MSASTSPMGAGAWLNPGEQQVNKIVQAVRQLMEGRSNNCGSFTLTSNSAISTVNGVLVGINSVITWQPISTNAAPQMTLLCVASQYGSTLILNHGSNAATDQTFVYVVTG